MNFKALIGILATITVLVGLLAVVVVWRMEQGVTPASNGLYPTLSEPESEMVDISADVETLDADFDADLQQLEAELSEL